MRFLKKKIALKLEASAGNNSDQDDFRTQFDVKQEDNSKVSSDDSVTVKEDILPFRGPRKNRTPANADSKNIIKNYGKALCAFASSNIALPYIQSVISKRGYDGMDIKKFMELMKQKKETTNSMESLRRLLIEDEDDTSEEKVFKRVFKEVSIIFMKYFSVNWIFSGKLVHKNVHLKFRFKMLRRIKNPEYFTYLKTSAKNL